MTPNPIKNYLCSKMTRFAVINQSRKATIAPKSWKKLPVTEVMNQKSKNFILSKNPNSSQFFFQSTLVLNFDYSYEVLLEDKFFLQIIYSFETLYTCFHSANKLKTETTITAICTEMSDYFFSSFSPMIQVSDNASRLPITLAKDQKEYTILTVQFKHEFILPLSSIDIYVMRLDIRIFMVYTSWIKSFISV